VRCTALKQVGRREPSPGSLSDRNSGAMLPMFTTPGPG
jgi:hypothetical protein